MNKDFQGAYAFKTDIGKVRQSNEDQAMVLTSETGEVFLVVCDGMGGANKGDVASKAAVDSLAASFKKKKRNLFAGMDRLWITKAAKAANKVIFDQADKNPAYKGMGTTMVAALISGNRLLIANIGDSRAYMLVKGKLTQMTEDQTYVQYLLNTGKITPEQALSHPERHVLMNALGINPSVSLTLISKPYAGNHSCFAAMASIIPFRFRPLKPSSRRTNEPTKKSSVSSMKPTPMAAVITKASPIGRS
jgi:serine/threonine protein phosphatase PrpC